MVSMPSLQEKYNQVKRSFVFYLDVKDRGIYRTIFKRIEDLGLQQELFLTARVTHVVRDGPASAPAPAAPWPREARGRAHAMLQCIRPEATPSPPPHTNYTALSVQKAIILLDKIYDTFFSVPTKTSQSLKIFKKHYIKIEFLDKVCRPVYKEFDEWPEISVDPDPPKEKFAAPEQKEDFNRNITNSKPAGQKMTRKSRPRVKEREEEPKGGYCEMCNTEYANGALHRRSPHHLSFVRDHTNFLSLDSLIEAGADVATFLNKATPINGERRSMRNLCNGDSEPKGKRSRRSQSPDSTTGNQSPKRNGTLVHNTRCSKRISESQPSEDRQYYKVVSTKLRSSGGFSAKRRDSPPACNGGAKPIVVKFRKVRRSELSVLSDEAEQFMFPKRASSTSSTSSNEEEKQPQESPKKSPPMPQPSPALERRRLARPLALKEESSEEDGWPEDKRRRKRRGPPVVKRTRRVLSKLAPVEVALPPPAEPQPPPEPEAPVELVSPLRQEPVERCMKWEDGKLKYTPAVEQLEFAFESVPMSEPWFETFKRQDEDKVVAKNVPRYFSLYTTKSPKLPYEIGQLPPLKPNCCPLSDLVKRDEKAGPSRSYGTRGMKRQKIRKKTAAAALIALESHPRKSPREHASTLAMLGSAGLRKADDSKSIASEDTVSETPSNARLDPILCETQEAAERFQRFLSEVFNDAAEYDMSDEDMEGGEPAVTTSTNIPDVLSLVSECEGCEIIRDEIRQGAAARPRGRRGKLKKNRTGWPIKKKPVKKSSGPNSPDNKLESSLDGSSAEPDDDTTQESASEAEEPTLTETNGKDEISLQHAPKSEENTLDGVGADETNTVEDEDSDDKPLQLDVKVLVENESKKERDKRASRSSVSECEEKEEKSRKKRAVAGLGSWLQPVVRVARVDPTAARRLRSAGRGRAARFR